MAMYPFQLPAETWLQIISYVTLIPGALDTMDQEVVAAFTRDDLGVLAQSLHQASVQAKLSISIVSRSWNILASRYLWEHLIITSGTQALRVASILEDCPMKALGVVRLEVTLEAAQVFDSEHAKALASIIKACTNIACFSTVFSTLDAYYLYSPPILSALAATVFRPNPIKRLELRADVPIIATLVYALSSSLQVLWMQPARRTSVYPVLSAFELPKLHTCISTFVQDTCLRNAYTPSLATCIVDNPLDWDTILKRSGESVRRLSLPVSSTTALILKHCPILETLSFTTFNSNAFSLEITHPKLSSLVLESPQFFQYVCSRQVDEDVYIAFLKIMLSALVSSARFPSLKCLRLVLPCSVPQYLRQSHIRLQSVLPVWKAWLHHCSEHDICVQVAGGVPDVFMGTWHPLTVDTLDIHFRQVFLYGIVES